MLPNASPPLFIVGSGAIGSLLASGFSSANFDYQWIMREDKLPTSVVEAPNNDIVKLSTSCWQQQNKFCNDAVIFLPLKAHQIHSALTRLKPWLSPHTKIVLLHNGMGGAETALDILGAAQPVFLATTSHGALRVCDTTVRHTGTGNTTVGLSWLSSAADCSDNIASLLSLAFTPTESNSNVKMALWQKLVINAAINPLTAIHQIKNGGLNAPDYRTTLAAICREVCEVAQSEGITLDADTAIASVHSVVTATAENYSSMNRDLAAKRQTEIEAITGYIVQRGNKKGIDVTTNASLLDKIQSLSDYS